MTPDADLDVARLTPSEPVTAPEAAEAIRACFGLSGELTRLPGEADDNFLLDAGDDRRYVVKFAHLRADPGGGRRPGPGAAAHRGDRARPAGAAGAARYRGERCGRWSRTARWPAAWCTRSATSTARLLRSVATDPPLRRALGGTLAELGRALRGFDDPLVHRPLLWDLAQLPRLRPLVAERPPGDLDRGAVRQAHRRRAAAPGGPAHPARAQRLQPGQHADLGRRQPRGRDHRLRRRRP